MCLEIVSLIGEKERKGGWRKSELDISPLLMRVG